MTMLGTSSTLVETVSINYEDFNESFLTCGTCLCVYDGSEHTPKLLQCSHTVCLHCLARIAASQTRDNGTFRCPICRELITIPRGGVAALPPSFLVNQLLDLMSRQRREVIPKCSVHINQELLFCETCDAVFCSLCTRPGHHGNGAGGGGTSPTEHTIIPFSIAIKRMSEILLYKANECISKLTDAQDVVRSELTRLEQSSDRTREEIDVAMNEAVALVEQRRQQLLTQVTQVSSEKRKVLEEQLNIIEAEKNKVDKESGRIDDVQVERECEGLQYQVEVRNITQRVASLADKLDAASSLSEPRENSFLTCDFSHNDALTVLPTHVKRLGRVRASTTFPSLCNWHKEFTSAVVNLQSSVMLNTVDYRGDPRNTGGDPVTATLVRDTKETGAVAAKPVPVSVHDLDNGTYRITFRPTVPAKYLLSIRIFDRVIRDCPIVIDVTEHNNPVKSFGTKGSGNCNFLQPVAVAIDRQTDIIYVVDTGNSRIKVLTKDLEVIRHIENEGLEGRSCTGIDVCKQGLVVVNWRTKTITTMDYHGTTQSSFTSDRFSEPVDVCVDDEYSHYLVADNGVCAILVFDSAGTFLFQVGSPGCFSLISSLCVGQNTILVADTKIQIFSSKGDVVGEIGDGKDKGRYGGLCVDGHNRIIVARKEKNRNMIQVMTSPAGQILSTIDSNEFKLKRTGGVAVTSDNHVIVVDLANDCVRKYRYY